MESQNDFIKVLTYLLQFQNDSKYHEVEHLFTDNDERNRSGHIKRILKQLSENRLIELDRNAGFRPLSTGIYLSDGKTTKEVGRGDKSETRYIPFRARITLMGVQYCQALEQSAQEEASSDPQILQDNQPATTPGPNMVTNSNKTSQKRWNDTPSKTWQIIGVIVTIVLGFLAMLQYKGIL